MKRVLEVLALVLLAAGIELATGAVSYALGRLGGAFLGLVGGGEVGVGLPRLWAGVGMMLMGAALLALDVWARGQVRAVGSGKVCPRCSGPTARVKRELQHRLAAWILGGKITRRKCATCGWSGLST